MKALPPTLPPPLGMHPFAGLPDIRRVVGSIMSCFQQHCHAHRHVECRVPSDVAYVHIRSIIEQRVDNFAMPVRTRLTRQ